MWAEKNAASAKIAGTGVDEIGLSFPMHEVKELDSEPCRHTPHRDPITVETKRGTFCAVAAIAHVQERVGVAASTGGLQYAVY